MKIKTCPDCNGDGVVNKDTDNERQCSTCGGLGFVSDDDDGHEEVIKTTAVTRERATAPRAVPGCLESVAFIQRWLLALRLSQAV